ncbi:hypothetical protein DFH07DRAFT_966792 [Mycena maculata]|uniref:Uncharacterized protein n=1 Tax=Mycena maculata TaxID=230809 RepID=A0AAD7I723_9AGAR|nr:hypothetical protein DFH07DRAFT_966792 [Mycena maculata]
MQLNTNNQPPTAIPLDCRIQMRYLSLGSALLYSATSCSLLTAIVFATPVPPATTRSTLNVTLWGVSLSAHDIADIRQFDNAYHFVDVTGETLFVVQRDDDPYAS